MFDWAGERQKNVVTLPKRSCDNVENGVQIAGPSDSPTAVSLNYSGTFYFSSSLNRQCAAGSLFAVSVTPKNETAGKQFCCCVLALHVNIFADMLHMSCLTSGQLSSMCMPHMFVRVWNSRKDSSFQQWDATSSLFSASHCWKLKQGCDSIATKTKFCHTLFLVHAAWQACKQHLLITQMALHSTAQKILLAACLALVPKMWPCL